MKIKDILYCLSILLSLASCNLGNSSDMTSTESLGNATDLTIIPPNTVVSLPQQKSSNYAVIINKSHEQITGITYSIDDVIGNGSEIKIDPASSKACSSIAANSSCTVRLITPNNLASGSFSLSAYNKAPSQKLQNKVTIGIEPTKFSKNYPINTIKFNFYHNVIQGTKYLIVNGVVTSLKVTPFNMVTLTDAKGNTILNQRVISGNLGDGFTNLSQGSTFSILLPVPKGESANQTFGVKLSEVRNTKTISEYQLRDTYNLNVAKNKGIIEISPSSIKLINESTSTVTLYNIGNQSITLQNYSINDPNIKVIFNGDKVNPGGSLTGTLHVNNQSTTINSMLNLNFNITNNIETRSININGYYAKSKAKNKPIGLKNQLSNKAEAQGNTNPLTLELVPDNNFYTNTAIGYSTRSLIIQNNGSVGNESNITLTLPNNFQISSDLDPNENIPQCQISNKDNLSTSLPQSASCYITIVYNNREITAQNSQSITANYTYNLNGQEQSGANLITVNSQVSQATANLQITPPTQSFGYIVSGDTSSVSNYAFTIFNSGDIAATNMNTSIVQASPEIFQINSPTNSNGVPCGSELSEGESCLIEVMAGPVNSSFTGADFASLEVSYVSSNNQPNIESMASISVSVVQPQGANINLEEPTGEFTGGLGTSWSPYQIESQSIGILSYKYNNASQIESAYNFYFTYSLPTAAWNISNSGTTCGTINNPQTLPPGGSCTVQFIINTANIGPNDFNEQNIVAHWVDLLHPQGVSESSPTNTIYVNVYAPPEIVISTSQGNPLSIGDIQPGYSANIIATLQGGYYTKPMNINFTTSQSFMTLNGTPCSIDTNNPTCTVNLGVPAISSSYTPGAGYVAISSANNIPLSTQTITYNVTSTVTSKWQQLNTPTTAHLMTVDPSGILYYTYGQKIYQSQSIPVINNESSNFINYAHFQDITSIAAMPNGVIGVTSGSGKAYWTYVGGNSSPFPTYDSNYPSLIRYFNGTGKFYWGDANYNSLDHIDGGSLYWNTNYIGSPDDSDGIIDIALAQYINTPYLFAVSINLNSSTLVADSSIRDVKLISCGPGGVCGTVASNNNGGSITTDTTGNVYVGWEYDKIVEYGANKSGPSFTSPVTFEFPANAPTGNLLATSNCTGGYNTCLNTQVRWDSYSNQLLALFNYTNYVTLVGYDNNGNVITTFPALPEPPASPSNFDAYDLTYHDISMIQVDNANGIVYYLGQSGHIWYLQY